MRRLYYLFWMVPLFLAAGCGEKPRMVRVYRPEICHAETATPRPAGMIFDPPSLAWTNGFGRDVIWGIDLNRRPQYYTTNGWYDVAEARSYYLWSYDRHPGRHDDGYLNRTFRYRQGGYMQR